MISVGGLKFGKNRAIKCQNLDYGWFKALRTKLWSKRS